MRDNNASTDRVSKAALEAFVAHVRNHAPTGGLRAGVPTRVQRLDIDSTYILVPIYEEHAFCGIVQLTEADLTVETISRIRDPRSRFLLRAEEAQAAARTALPSVGDWGTPYLGWRPCRESVDSTRPFWVIPHATGQLFVGQSGEVLQRLSWGRGG